MQLTFIKLLFVICLFDYLVWFLFIIEYQAQKKVAERKTDVQEEAYLCTLCSEIYCKNGNW